MAQLHLREAADEEARVGLGDEVVGLEPGHVHRLPVGLNHGPKAHKGMHLVFVARHRAGHVVGQHAVGVQRVVARGFGVVAALCHAPQQPVHQRKSRGVAVQDELFAQAHKVGRHAQLRRERCRAGEWVAGG